MKKQAPQKKQVPHDKYFLRSLHQEIDLYDRKLAYLEKYAQFDSAADREEAENKLITKRASLAETAKQLVAEGVEFNLSDLPRSFRAAELEPAQPGSLISVQSPAGSFPPFRSIAIGRVEFLAGRNHAAASKDELRSFVRSAPLPDATSHV